MKVVLLSLPHTVVEDIIEIPACLCSVKDLSSVLNQLIKIHRLWVFTWKDCWLFMTANQTFNAWRMTFFTAADDSILASTVNSSFSLQPYKQQMLRLVTGCYGVCTFRKTSHLALLLYAQSGSAVCPRSRRCHPSPALCTHPALLQASNQFVLICYNGVPSGPYYTNPSDVIPKQPCFPSADRGKGMFSLLLLLLFVSCHFFHHQISRE